MFTTNHFIWMAICLVIIGLLTFLSIKFKFSLKTASFIMAGVAISSELLKIFTHMEPVTNGGMVIEPTALPLHICSMYIFVFLCRTDNAEERTETALLPHCGIVYLSALHGLRRAQGIIRRQRNSHGGLI